MVDLDDLRMFRALGVSRSLAAAARLLDVTPPALTVRMRRLEARLGVSLVVREPRGVSFTDEGQRLLQEATALLERLESLPQQVSGQAAGVSGNLRIVAPFGFGRRYIAPIVRDLHRDHPKLTITLHLSDNPLAEMSGADIVIHIGEARDSSWVGHPLAPNERVLCASPACLARLPPITHPSELAHLPCLCLRENDEDVTRWRFTEATAGRGRAGLQVVNVRVSGALSSNDGTVISDWAADGLGVMVRSEWDAAPLLAAGSLVRLLPGWALKPAPVMALVPTRKGISPRQRLFLEAARRALDPVPWRQGGAAGRRRRS
ncbi:MULTISPECIES: LysR family transcriptional regulator [Ralstonia solanacearum species complex]|nr:LysR family transcriptional regulator [Ralstonia solanacearum]ALF87135.1 HTH-type transcriptional regulator DmlR [Ralstonia solanacearum]ATI26681.1 LysR family transcriptional regulator [Ralstonia solanacearum]KEI31807.1 LysR family transcriptional regulator [Ralstonia solanacearum]KFX80432.1 LysR family transcriptional regulator [Ralstonia solanacearum]KFX83404.1 LysR family transcriptional regulator [Ralstonia solanacearum]